MEMRHTPEGEGYGGFTIRFHIAAFPGVTSRTSAADGNGFWYEPHTITADGMAVLV